MYSSKWIYQHADVLFASLIVFAQSQCVLIADAQAILTITVASPHPYAHIARKLALISMIATLLAIITALVSTTEDINRVPEVQSTASLDLEVQGKPVVGGASICGETATNSAFEKSLRAFGFFVVLVAFILFITATAAIPIS